MRHESALQGSKQCVHLSTWSCKIQCTFVHVCRTFQDFIVYKALHAGVRKKKAICRKKYACIIYVHVCMYAHVYMYVCVCVCVCVHACTHVRMHVHVCMYVCMYVYMYVCTYVSVCVHGCPIIYMCPIASTVFMCLYINSYMYSNKMVKTSKCHILVCEKIKQNRSSIQQKI